MNKETARTIAFDLVMSCEEYERDRTHCAAHDRKNIYLDRASIGLPVSHFETVCACGTFGCAQSYLFQVTYNARGHAALVSVSDCGRPSVWMD